MNRSGPQGTLGGGGWESSRRTGADYDQNKRDKVLTDMYDKFLDSLEAEIIQTVVESCNFNHKKSMDALLDMCNPTTSSSIQQIHAKPPTMRTQQTNNTVTPVEEKPFSSKIVQGSNHNKKMTSLPSFPHPSKNIVFGGGSRTSTNQNVAALKSPSVSLPYSIKKKKHQDLPSNEKINKIKSLIENGQKILILMRGCPGSGKSFLARNIITFFEGDPKDHVFSTDDFFVKRNGYFFDASSLQDAHQWNQRRVLERLREGRSPIIVDNTNTQMWEMLVYASNAINNGYIIEILEPDTPWFKKADELAKKTEHQVPREKIKIMLDRYEFGISVESLIKATGAQYSKPVPQAAKYPLTSRKIRSSRSPNAPSMKTREVDGLLQEQTRTSSFSLMPNFSNLKCDKNATKILSDSAQSVPKADCFYFGPHTSSSMKTFETIPKSTSNLNTESSQDSVLTLSGANAPIDHYSPGKIEFGFKEILPQSETAAFKEETSPLSATHTVALEKNGVDSKSLNSQTISLSVATIENKSVALPNTEVNETATSAGIPVEMHEEIAESLGGTDSTPRSSGALVNEIKPNATDNFHDGNGFEDKNIIPDERGKLMRGTESSESSAGSSLKESTTDVPDVLQLGNLPQEKLKTGIFDFSSINNALPQKSKSDDSGILPLKRGSEEYKTSVFNVPPFSSVSQKAKMSGSQSVESEGVPATSREGPGLCVSQKTENTGDILENSSLKLSRCFSSKSINDYCQSVRDINAAIQNESTDRAFCESSNVSWQPIQQIQEEIFRRERSLSPSRILENSKRSRFRQCEFAEKATNTHHTDFCILSNLSSNEIGKDVTVLIARDRDINEGRPISNPKVNLKLMLDRGTSTENDFDSDMQQKESKQEKTKELVRLFPDRSPASIKELLRQCNWDVNYVSNILLDDTGFDQFTTDVNIDEDSDSESITQEETKEINPPTETDDKKPSSAAEDTTAVVNYQVQAEEVKRHIQQSIDFSEGCYSPHTLAIKNFRRGLREGAIPKKRHFGDAEEADTLNHLNEETRVEPSQTTSESSDEMEEEETLEFIVGSDFMQQLVDKFGGSHNVSSMTPVVKFPVSLARQIYDSIFSPSNSEEEDDGDVAMKLQCEEDERWARQMYEEMLQNSDHSSQPQLREIMDMELAQAIYKADVDSLTQNSPETMANVLAKRLLEDNYQNVDKKVLHDIFVSCNYSFEDTVKTLQEALSTDGSSATGNMSKGVAGHPKQTNLQGKLHGTTSSDIFSDKQELKCVNDIEDENPWELTDPSAEHKRHREKADEYLKMRDEMYRKASDAFRRNERSVAAYYAKLGELNGKKHQHASAMAAAALVASHANSHSSDTLDLHHYRVVEAITIFDLYIDYHVRLVREQGPQQQCLSIITGRGTHSVNGKPKIKPAIINRVKKRNLRHQPFPNNPGVIKVWVTSSSYLSHEITD